jgi:hypothetical protein
MSRPMAWNPNDHEISLSATVTIPRKMREPRVPIDPIMHGEREHAGMNNHGDGFLNHNR